MRGNACLLFVLLLQISAAEAGYVTPKIGGGQVGSGAEDPQLMIHIHVGYDSNSSSVHVGIDPGMPTLRALEPPDEFDPAEPWGVLGTKAYNYQYGWLASSFDFPPVGAWFWIEQLSATSGLETYQRPPASPSYAPIFGTEGTSTRWRWSGSMTHNAYAVQDPSLNLYEAEYRIYIGDDVTGEPLSGYTYAEITLQFNATPVLLADFDDDDDVDNADLLRWEGDFGSNSDSDADSDDDSDGFDFLIWQQETGSATTFPLATDRVPEPTSVVLMFAAMSALIAVRRRI